MMLLFFCCTNENDKNKRFSRCCTTDREDVSLFLLNFELNPSPDKEHHMAAKRTKAAKPAVEEIEEDLTVTEVEEEDFDLEEAEEAPAPKKAAKKAPAKKAAPAKAAAPKIEFGTKELAAHVNEAAGTSYDAYNLRILLRKLTKDGVLERVESEGRSRYSFTGPNDPQVAAIVEAVKSGAAEKAKTERLDKLKADRAAKKTAAPKKTKKAAAEAEPEVDEEDDFETEDI